MYESYKQTNKAATPTQNVTEFLQVYSRSCLYSVCSRYTIICSLYVIERYLAL